MKHLAPIGAGAAALALVSLFGTLASAEETTVVTQQPVEERVSTYSGPDRGLIASGLVTFGLSYGAGVIVAAQSSQAADHHLYVPVVGPWLDMANRPACGPGSVLCDTETTNKVLIGVDGVFQAIGALTTVAGFLTPEHTTAIAKTDEPTVTLHVTPAKLGIGGYGLAAFGDF